MVFYYFPFPHYIAGVKLMFVYDIILVNDVVPVFYNVLVSDYLL